MRPSSPVQLCPSGPTVCDTHGLSLGPIPLIPSANIPHSWHLQDPGVSCEIEASQGLVHKMALYSLLAGSPTLLNVSQPCGSFSEPRCKHPWSCNSITQHVSKTSASRTTPRASFRSSQVPFAMAAVAFECLEDGKHSPSWPFWMREPLQLYHLRYPHL